MPLYFLDLIILLGLLEFYMMLLSCKFNEWLISISVKLYLSINSLTFFKK